MCRFFPLQWTVSDMHRVVVETARRCLKLSEHAGTRSVLPTAFNCLELSVDFSFSRQLQNVSHSDATKPKRI